MKLNNKVISVTGGASGIGEEIVRRLSSEGAHVAIIDIDEDNGNRISNSLENAAFFYGDVTDPEKIAHTFSKVQAHFGRLDGAVNNAGIGGDMCPTAEYTIESWRRVMSINLDGVFYCIKAQIPLILNEGGGAIINVASILGVVGQSGIAGYVASKHGVIGLTKTVAADYGRQGLRCNAVCPSYIKTPLTEDSIDADTWKKIEEMHSIGKCVSKEDVAAMVAFLASDDAKTVSGSVHLVDGGYTSV